MTVLIGITQNLESAKEKLAAQHSGLGVSTEVGPFVSREKAAEWQHFMSSRRDNYEEFETGDMELEGSMWYGLTIEESKVH